MDGFAIGPTTNPCTKGIWAWSTAVKLNDSTDMIILDTEGLNSVCKLINNDNICSDFMNIRKRSNNRYEDIFNICTACKHVRL